MGILVTEMVLEMYPGLRVGPATVRLPLFPRRAMWLTGMQKVRALVVGNSTLAHMYVHYLASLGWLSYCVHVQIRAV